MNITASWIWPADSDGRGFNLCSVFRRDFRLESVPASARILITADSYYRLKINGQWIGDGPARAYPERGKAPAPGGFRRRGGRFATMQC